MPPITGTPRPVTPVGYEVVVSGRANEALTRGQALIQTATGWSRAPAGAADFHGVAMQDYYAGQGGISVLKQGEFDGYTGLTPGAPVYVSPTVAGGLDTTATIFYSAATTPAVAVPSTPRARAVGATRIYFNCV